MSWQITFDHLKDLKSPRYLLWIIHIITNFTLKSSCTKCRCGTSSIKHIFSQKTKEGDWDKRCRYCSSCCKATLNQASLYTLKRCSGHTSITSNCAKCDSLERRLKWQCGQLFLCDYVRRTCTLSLSSSSVRHLATKYGET